MSTDRQGQSAMLVAHPYANRPANTVWTATFQAASYVRNGIDDPRLFAHLVPRIQNQLVGGQEVVKIHQTQPMIKNSSHHPTPNHQNLEVRAKVHCPNHFQDPYWLMKSKAQHQASKYLPSARLQKAPLQGYLPMKERWEVEEDLRWHREKYLPLLRLHSLVVGLVQAMSVCINSTTDIEVYKKRAKNCK